MEDETLLSLKDIIAERTKGSFIHAAGSSAFLISLSEIGDVTFFITVVMAMRHNRLPVLLGAIGGNALIHTFAVGAGSLTNKVLPLQWIHGIAAIFYAIMAILVLRNGLRMSKHRAKNEFEQCDSKLRKNGPAKRMLARISSRIPSRLLSRAFVETFALILFEGLADRTQLATLVMAANKHTVGIVVGGLIGHTLSAALAVLGGKSLAFKMSTRSMTLGASAMYILFTIMAVLAYLT